MFKRLTWRFLKSIAGTSFEREYKEARRLEVTRALKSLLFHAYNNVPYYRDVLTRENVVKDGKVNLANFSQIPILTKEIIRRRTDELISGDYKKRKWSYSFSGGSTGEPVKLVQDRKFQKWTDATSRFYYEDVLDIEETFARKIILWGARRDIIERTSVFAKKAIYNALTGTVFLDSFSMTEVNMEHFVQVINSYKPEIIRGYAVSLYDLCKFVKKKKLSISRPKIVVSTAETLHDVMRKKIEDVFRAKVCDFYGSREVGAMAGECGYGLLHIFMFNNYLEVLDHNNQKVKEGETGRVIVTTLHNFSMPLLRFDIGDMAVLGPEKCKCGNPLPTLRKIIGRQVDNFVRKDGKIIYGFYFIRLIRTKDWVKAFKLIQEDYNKIGILIVLRNGIVNESEKREIEEKIKLVMGRDCKLRWEVVDEIPKTRTGKYLYVQSLLSVR